MAVVVTGIIRPSARSSWIRTSDCRNSTPACLLDAKMISVSDDGHVHYARNGSVRLAYRIWGEKEPTVVWVPGWISNVDAFDMQGPEGLYPSFPDHLARQTRLVAWDKRGTGLSD